MARCYTEGCKAGLRPAYFLLLCVAVSFWVVLLAGVSAVQKTLGSPSRPIQGLPWFIIWFQFVILLLLLPVKVRDNEQSRTVENKKFSAKQEGTSLSMKCQHRVYG